MSAASAIARIATGGFVVVARENEARDGDLVMATDAITTEGIAFLLQHTSGVISAALRPERVAALGLAPIAQRGHVRNDPPAFTVSVDLKASSAAGAAGDARGQTLRALGDEGVASDAFVQPGHVFPLSTRAGGVLAHRGRAEAAIDLARLAGRAPASALAAVASADKHTLAGGDELTDFARRFGLPVVTVSDVARQVYATEPVVECMATARIPCFGTDFAGQVWRSTVDGREHFALVLGDVASADAPLLSIHPECTAGDIFRSTACDCRAQLEKSVRQITQNGAGVLVYTRMRPKAGTGFVHRARAAANGDGETGGPPTALESEATMHERGVSAQIVRALGISRVRLLSSSSAEAASLGAYGVDVVERQETP